MELAKHAKAAGASGVAAISPYYAPNLPEDFLFASVCSKKFMLF
ncbi:MAG: hypothetical protein H0Z38_09845 [Firmicutes bacterium]|nr:hypothetical protein [Bacillota bacterium]